MYFDFDGSNEDALQQIKDSRPISNSVTLTLISELSD